MTCGGRICVLGSIAWRARDDVAVEAAIGPMLVYIQAILEYHGLEEALDVLRPFLRTGPVVLRETAP